MNLQYWHRDMEVLTQSSMRSTSSWGKLIWSAETVICYLRVDFDYSACMNHIFHHSGAMSW